MMCLVSVDMSYFSQRQNALDLIMNNTLQVLKGNGISLDSNIHRTFMSQKIDQHPPEFPLLVEPLVPLALSEAKGIPLETDEIVTQLDDFGVK